jgi:hypothetical protein
MTLTGDPIRCFQGVTLMEIWSDGGCCCCLGVGSLRRQKLSSTSRLGADGPGPDANRHRDGQRVAVLLHQANQRPPNRALAPTPNSNLVSQPRSSGLEKVAPRRVRAKVASPPFSAPVMYAFRTVGRSRTAITTLADPGNLPIYGPHDVLNSSRCRQQLARLLPALPGVQCFPVLDLH